MKKHHKIYTGAAVAALLMGTAVAVPQTIIPEAAITASAAETTRATIDKVEYEFDLSAKTATITELDYDCESFTTPEKVRYNGVDYDVTAVAGHSLIKRPKLKELTITSNIKSLGQMFCGNCFALEKVTINGTPKIESDAFFCCKALKEVVLDDSITKLGEFMFGGCESLETITLPSGLTIISKGAFQNCKSLSTISIPDSVNTIGVEAFSQCTALESVKMSEKLEKIGEEAFWNCTSLSSVTFNNGLQSIEDCAFRGCTSLTLPSLPSSLTTLGDNVFESDISITGKLIIPQTLKTIGENCFRGTGLSEVQTQGELTIKRNTFNGANNLTKVTLSGKEKLEAMAFAGCENLSNLVVPISGNLDWSYNAFDNCSNLLNINNTEVTWSFNDDKNDMVFDNGEFDTFIRKYFNASTGVGFVDKYVDDYCKHVISTCTKPGMSKLQIAKALHDWVIFKVEYDSKDVWAERNHCDVSIFLNDKSVCEGYAKGYSLLMKAAGFDTIDFANGDHVWNKCKIDDMYFYVDTCWDDEGKNIKTGEDYEPSYEWFMLSGKELIEQDTKNHHFGIEPYDSLTEIPMGDLNMNKVIDEADLEIMESFRTDPKRIKGKMLILGDLNFDGRVNQKDLDLLVKKYEDRFDLNDDGEVNNSDLAFLNFILTTDKELTYSKSLKADNNNDGVVDAKDAEDMRYYLEKYKGQNSNNYYRMGDLNLDGTVDNNDLKALQKYGKLFIDYKADLELGDFNGDSYVNLADYRILVSLIEHQLGDVDFSGTVDSTDRDLIIKHIEKSELLPDDALWYADLNGDGAIDVKDIKKLCADHNITD